MCDLSHMWLYTTWLCCHGDKLVVQGQELNRSETISHWFCNKTHVLVDFILYESSGGEHFTRWSALTPLWPPFCDTSELILISSWGKVPVAAEFVLRFDPTEQRLNEQRTFLASCWPFPAASLTCRLCLHEALVIVRSLFAETELIHRSSVEYKPGWHPDKFGVLTKGSAVTLLIVYVLLIFLVPCFVMKHQKSCWTN